MDFPAFLAACSRKYSVLMEMAADSTTEGEELLSAAQRAALLVLLGGGAPNCRPGQLWPLAVAGGVAPPCLAADCAREGCLGNTLKVSGGGARLMFYHHKCFQSWKLEPAFIEIQVCPAAAACRGRATVSAGGGARAGGDDRSESSGHRGGRGAARRARQRLGSALLQRSGAAHRGQHLPAHDHRLAALRSAAGHRRDRHRPAARAC